MRTFSVGEAAAMLRVGPHVIRYWEEAATLLSGKRDNAGRREYTAQDIAVFSRLRHLIRGLGYTVPGACRRLEEEATGNHPEVRGLLQALRGRLLDCLSRRGRETGRLDLLLASTPPSCVLPQERRKFWSAALGSSVIASAIRLRQAMGDSGLGGATKPPAPSLRPRPGVPVDRGKAAMLVKSGSLACVTVVTDSGRSHSATVASVKRQAASLAALRHRSVWYLLYDECLAAAVEGATENLTDEIQLVPRSLPRLPAFSSGGSLAERRGLPVFENGGWAAAVAVLVSTAFRNDAGRRGLELVAVGGLNRYCRGFPHPGVVDYHLARGVGITAAVHRCTDPNKSGPRTTGLYLIDIDFLARLETWAVLRLVLISGDGSTENENEDGIWKFDSALHLLLHHVRARACWYDTQES